MNAADLWLALVLAWAFISFARLAFGFLAGWYAGIRKSEGDPRAFDGVMGQLKQELLVDVEDLLDEHEGRIRKLETAVIGKEQST